MTLHVGLLSIPYEAQAETDGTRAGFRGIVKGPSLVAARRSWAALVGRVEPVWWTADASVDGFYKIVAARVVVSPSSPFSGAYEVSVEAERHTQGAALFASSLDGFERPGATSMATAANRREWFAVPNSASLRKTAGTATTRSGPGGSVAMRYSDMSSLIIYGQTFPWGIAPEDFYDMAPVIRDSDGNPIVGSNVDLMGLGGFTVDNGLVEWSQSGTNTYGLRGRANSSASLWSNSVLQWLMGTGTGTTSPGAISAARTIRTTPEECVWETVHGTSTLLILQWGMRRGALGVTLYGARTAASTLSARTLSSLPQLTAVQVGGNNRGAQSALVDGGRLCIFAGSSSQAIENDSQTNDQFRQTNSTSSWSWYFGHVPPSASANVNDAAGQGMQFYGCGIEHMSLVR